MNLKVIIIGLMAFVLACNSQLSADLFVSAASANSVMRFDGNTGNFLGNFVAPNSGGLGDPQGIAFGPDNNLYVASHTSRNVLRFNGQTGAFIDVFATTAGMNWPAEINFRGGHLYVSDFSGGAIGRVSRFNATTGAFVDHFVTGASLADGTAWDAAGDLYVSNFGTDSIRKYNGTTGNLIGDFVSPGLGGLDGPLDNLFLPDGTFLVSSFNTGNVKRYNANGAFIGNAITGLSGGPQGLEIGPDGMLYAGDFGNGLINRYDIDTFQLLGTFANAASTTNNFVFRPEPIPEPVALMPLLLGMTVACMKRRNKTPQVA